jgi:hypothetical protein
MKPAPRRTKIPERTPAAAESLPSAGVLIGLPSETIAAGYAQPETIGLPIMPDGFVVDTGFLATAKTIWR